MLLPFTINKITFSENITNPYLTILPEKEETFYSWEDKEIKEFLKSLGNDDNYIVNMQFIPSDLDMDAPNILLSKPFLINRHSSPTTIIKFINERLHFMIEKYYLDDIVIQPDVVGPMIKFHYCIIHVI